MIHTYLVMTNGTLEVLIRSGEIQINAQQNLNWILRLFRDARLMALVHCH